MKLEKNYHFGRTKIIVMNIKYLNISYDSGKLYDITKYTNLEYLSFSLKSSNVSITNEKIKIILSENQFKNIKTLKIIEFKDLFYTINNITFESENAKDNGCFENIQDLEISEKLLNKIKFNSKKLKKLSIVYDYRKTKYTNEDIENSINYILEKYISLTTLNISFYYVFEYKKSIIKEVFDILIDSIKIKENISFNFWELEHFGLDRYFEKLCFSIKNIPKKKSKFIIKGSEIVLNLIQSHFDQFEEIDLSLVSYKKCNLYIEENSSISSLTKIRIKYGSDDSLIIPIKSFASLNTLQLSMDNIIFLKEFPLFSKDSKIKFDNLEYLDINFEEIDKITLLVDNFCNMPNLRFLSIINKNICNTVFPYYKEIFAKCKFLKKLHTLIFEDEYNTKLKLNDVNIYYSIFPELQNTNIRFCSISKYLCK